MTINNNTYINSNIYLDKDLDKTSINTKQESAKLETSSLATSTSFASEFGFRTDEQGFFSKELNKTANIPTSYDINIKSIRLLSKLEPNLDIASTLNSYFNTLSAVNSDFNTNSYLTRDQISKLFAGFSTTDTQFQSPITRLYTKQDLNLNQEKLPFLNALMLDNKITNFHFDKALNDTSNNEILKPYINSNSEVSKSGLLLNFIYNDLNVEPVASFSTFELDLNSHKTFHDLLNSKQDLEEYLRQSNSKKMSFDLYLHVNGIDKTKLNQDKLFNVYQQYLNYQKDYDLKEFANSSSIFQLYINQNKDEFNQLKQNLSPSNNQKIEDINLERTRLNHNFEQKKQRRITFDKVITSYLAAMS